MHYKRLIHTVLIIMIAGAAVSGVADNISQTYSERALKRALTTFAVARTLNGVISVAQGTEIALEPGGVGVMLTPGQILDPVNDLVERFSSVMLVAASSLGLQIILLEILSWWIVTAMLVASLAIWIASLWSPELGKKGYVRLTIRLALILTVVRFAIPVVIISTNFLFDTFLLSKHEAATAELQTSATRIEELNTQFDDAEPGKEVSSRNDQATPDDSSDDSFFQLPDLEELASELKNSAEKLYSDASNWLSSISISAKIEQLQESAAEVASHIVNLIVIFVLQTIVFPLGFLWLFVEVLKQFAARALSYAGGEQSEQ